MPGRRDSEEKADASTVVAKHWRGLTRRVAVLRKWSWVVSNNFEHKDEEKMLDLGLFVQSIEHELAAEPSLRRRSTSGVQLLTRGASSTAAAGSSDAPVQRDFSLSFPLREPDVLEMIASFSRGQRVDPASVEKLLELQGELRDGMIDAGTGHPSLLRLLEVVQATAASAGQPMSASS